MGNRKPKLHQSAPLNPRHGTRHSSNSDAANLYRDRSPKPRLVSNDVADRPGTQLSPTHSLDVTPSSVKPSYYKHWGVIQIGISVGLWLVLIGTVKLIVALI
jgi:hypothetical protein